MASTLGDDVLLMIAAERDEGRCGPEWPAPLKDDVSLTFIVEKRDVAAPSGQFLRNC